MMLYYQTLLTILIGVAIASFFVGLIIKRWPVRIILWFFSVAFVVLTVSTIRKNASVVTSETSRFVGDYVIDTTKSKYSLASKDNFKNLKLIVLPDETFHFNGDEIPFLTSSGRWKFTNNEDGGYLECFMGNKKITAYHLTTNDYWVFGSDAVSQTVTSDVFYFQRVK